MFGKHTLSADSCVCVCHAPHQANDAEYPRTEPPKRANTLAGRFGRFFIETYLARPRVLHKAPARVASGRMMDT
eukprot:6531554-Prymnesium_polylepis.1